MDPDSASERTVGPSPSLWQSVMGILRGTGGLWSEHNILQMSAALSYYSIFSMAPLLVIAMAVAGEVFGADAVRGQVNRELSAGLGPAVAGMIQSMVQSAYQPGKGIWAAMVGLVALLIGASGVFGQLKSALDLVWDTPRKKTSGVIAFIRSELVSFGMVLVIGFLMLTSLLLTTAVAATWEFVAIYVPFSKSVVALSGFVVSGCVIGTLFAFIFKWLPDLPVRWRQAWIGGFFTSALFEIGKFVLALYLGRESATSSYGAAGAVILVLLWTYYSSAIVLTGACFTRAYGDWRVKDRRLRGPLGKTRTPDDAIQ